MMAFIMEIKPIIIRSTLTARHLRVVVRLNKETALEGMAVQGRSLLVEYSQAPRPEQVLRHTLQLDAPLLRAKTCCLIKEDGGGQMVILWGPLDATANQRRSA